jgi:polysaccharide deacetylase family protein (PEP-CTERM system associated)
MSIINALSFDVEDYFQVSAFERVIDRRDWDRIEHRVEKNTDRILEILANADVRATFFMLGWVADRYPALVRGIVDGGHELACHGYAHQRVHDLKPEQFKQDILRSRGVLEDIGGHQIKGYRAPSYSIGKRNLWALDILAECEFQYSSSIYPIKHDHYGFPGAPRFVFKDQKTSLIEIPISTVKLFNQLRPAGGGGFFRFYPYRLTRWLIDRINSLEGEPAIFYLHPWELDAEQPRQSRIPYKTRFRHYLNLNKTQFRLTNLLEDFSWGRMDEVFLSGRNIPEYQLT